MRTAARVRLGARRGAAIAALAMAGVALVASAAIAQDVAITSV